MPSKPYNWSDPSAPPILHPHSVAKHEIIEAYLKRYVEMATSDFRRKKLRLTVVDGFCGGGVYRHAETNKLCLGSPLIFLKTIQEIETLNKNCRIDAAYYFIDRDPSALASLRMQLKKRGYSGLIGNRTFLIQGNFAEHYRSLAQIISSRGSRVLFLLDQYGYKDAPVSLIQQIINFFPQAEILLTFAVDAMLNYISSAEQFHSYTRKLDPKGRLLFGNDIKEAKRLKKLGTRKKPGDWRKVISRRLLRRFLRLCGKPHCAPYFIVSRTSHRAYWLLHLSGNLKSKNAMLKLHRIHHNVFEVWEQDTMFGFDPRKSRG